MLETGNSRPASGSEHQFSHYWEMTLLREGRPAVYHGSKVGFASIWIARYYEMVRKTSEDEVADCLENTAMFDSDVEIQKITRGYGKNIAASIVKTQESHLSMTPEKYAMLKNNIVDHWDAIQEIASTVPSSDEIISLLKSVGGATEPADIGLTNADIRNAMEYAQFVRNAFTILNVSQMLGWKPILQRLS